MAGTPPWDIALSTSCGDGGGDQRNQREEILLAHTAIGHPLFLSYTLKRVQIGDTVVSARGFGTVLISVPQQGVYRLLDRSLHSLLHGRSLSFQRNSHAVNGLSGRV
jgi:hypothetical protein